MQTPTIARQLKPFEIKFETLHLKYHSQLSLVEELIGVTPNCDPLLEIWSPGFRTYNLLVPNFLNLPFSLWGFKSLKKFMGLAMYVSSRAAGCAYCSAHTCSFALRRGVSSQSLFGDRVPREIAVVEVAEALSRIPCDLSLPQVKNLARYFSPSEMEWIVLSIGMMGFLNKFMDVLGVELEADAVGDVSELLTPTGWNLGQHAPINSDIPSSKTEIPKDSLKTYLRVVRQAPSALSWEKQWMGKVPKDSLKARAFLKQRTGNCFPILAKLKHKRAIVALTAILRDNLDTEQSELGLPTKCLAGAIFATALDNSHLVAEAKLLLANFAPEWNDDFCSLIAELIAALDLENPLETERVFLKRLVPIVGEKTAAALIFAKAAAPSPAKIAPHLLPLIERYLTPASTIELVVWLSIQQMLHRLDRFWAIDNLQSKVFFLALL